MRSFTLRHVVFPIYDSPHREEWDDYVDSDSIHVYIIGRALSRFSLVLDDGRVVWVNQHWFKISLEGDEWDALLIDVPERRQVTR
jgi:hypothetical protein